MAEECRGWWVPLAGFQLPVCEIKLNQITKSGPKMILDSTNVMAVRLFFPLDPCDNFPCKRGKTCKLDADNKPGCVCQEPAECPPSVTEYDHVGYRLSARTYTGFQQPLYLIKLGLSLLFCCV